MIVVRGGLVLPGVRARATHADILIEAGFIRDIGPPGMEAPEGTPVIDAVGRLVMPGLVNAHTHSHYAFGKGLGDRWTLEMMLNAAPGLVGGLRADDLHLSTLCCAMEMVRKGCTSCYDLVIQAPMPSRESTMAVGNAYQAVGMRAVVAFQMADTTFWRSIPDLLESIPAALREPLARIAATPYEQSLAACRDLIGSWPFDWDKIKPAIAPTIPLLCSDDFLLEAGRLSREMGVGLHTHLAETKVQAVTAIKRYGHSLTQHLEGLDYLAYNFTAAHAVWLDHDDMRRLADNGCCIAHNPGSNLRLGSGIAAVSAMRRAGLTVGIGTDACTCSDNLNMYEAMRLAALVSRATSPDPADWISANEAFEMATEGGARAAGLEKVGRIAEGWHADMVFLDLDSLSFVPLNDATRQAVFNEDGSAIRAVMIGGEIVFADGQFKNVDEAAIVGQVRSASDRLRGDNELRREEFAAVEGIISQFCVGLMSQPHPVRRYVG